MSLRVLLADESASIRKVFQMGLQDYGAEVKSVHNGLDVVEVAENYQPHIVFADILLQKKNGYEVCLELQQNPKLSNVPTVLMWSSFMELDQKKYQSSGAQGELEKPFDIEIMRTLIKQLVDQAKEQQISSFLKFPDSIKKDFVEEEAKKADLQGPKTQIDPIKLDLEEPAELENNQSNYQAPESTSVFNLQDVDASFDLAELENITSPEVKEDVLDIADGSWTAKPLTDQSIEPKLEHKTEEDMDQFQSMNLQSENKLNLDDFLYKPEQTNATLPPEPVTDNKTIHIPLPPPLPEQRSKATETISAQEAEHIIRQETRSLLKQEISKQLPQILEKVIREELNKVLEQEMALKSSEKNS